MGNTYLSSICIVVKLGSDPCSRIPIGGSCQQLHMCSYDLIYGSRYSNMRGVCMWESYLRRIEYALGIPLIQAER